MTRLVDVDHDSFVFLYPGQGTQRVGMGQWLLQTFAVARQVFDEASETLGYDLRALCRSGPVEKLTRTRYAQPAIFTCNAAADAVLRCLGCIPIAAAGHSLGEFNALVAVGALDFTDALELVDRRASLMDRVAAPGLMGAIVGFSTPQVERLCTSASQGDRLVVALENAPNQIVISGDAAAVERCLDLARRNGARRAVVIPTSQAFHSPLMEEIVQEWRSVVDGIPLRAPELTLAVNTTGAVESSAVAIRRAIVDQMTSRVRWTDCVRSLSRTGTETFVEVGDAKVLSRFHRSMASHGRCLGMSTRRDLDAVVESALWRVPA